MKILNTLLIRLHLIFTNLLWSNYTRMSSQHQKTSAAKICSVESALLVDILLVESAKIILCVIMRRAFVSDSASRSCSAAVAVSSFKLWFEKWGKAWHLKLTNENRHQLGRISISYLKFCTKGSDFFISTICRLFCSFKSSLWQENFQCCNKNS